MTAKKKISRNSEPDGASGCAHDDGPNGQRPQLFERINGDGGAKGLLKAVQKSLRARGDSLLEPRERPAKMREIEENEDPEPQEKCKKEDDGNERG